MPLAFGAIAKPRIRNTGYVRQPGRNQVNPVDYYLTVTRELDAAHAWGLVDKVGVATGWTAGQLRHVCVDVAIDPGGVRIVYRCQTVADYDSDGSDSGAPVFKYYGHNYVAMLGIHWGSNRAHGGNHSWFSHLHQIRNDLGLFYDDTFHFRSYVY